MKACAVIAFGASSAFGEGDLALGVGAVGETAPVAIARDDELDAAKLSRPFCARVDLGAEPGAVEVDRATTLLERALVACAKDLDSVMPGWRDMRVGLAIGSSSGGMRSFERAFAKGGAPEGSAAATYLGPVLGAARPCDFEPMAFVLGACASSTIAVGLAREWLLAGACDVALCGGFDAVSVFVASGFEVLRAVCADGCPRPFRVGRDGLALGEGAAVIALVREQDARNGSIPDRGFVAGFGASCDAVHLTAPDREGRGLTRAAAQALGDAGSPQIDLISAHGTATEFNDAAEARALLAVLGARTSEVPLFALKGGVGHTLGAAGALEILAALRAMKMKIAPASAGRGMLDGGVRVVERAERCEARAALKLAAAFGGANAAVVLTRDGSGGGGGGGSGSGSGGGSGSGSGGGSGGGGGSGSGAGAGRGGEAGREVFVSRGVVVASGDVEAATESRALAALCGYAEDRLARADLLVRLAIASVARLRDAMAAAGQGSLEGAGIVVGHGLATIDTNATYLARILSAGASRGEPRRFPYTSPNAPAGECAVAFGLTGPGFAVGGGPHGGLEALAVAADLVRGGVADRMVVLALDEAGEASRRLAPDTRPGAVALLVSSRRLEAKLVACSVRLAAQLPPGGALVMPRAASAHRALLPLENQRPEGLEAATPWGGFAKARFFWL